MTKYRVVFEVEMPDAAPEEEVRHFIEFEIGARATWTPMTEALKRTDLQSCPVYRVEVDRA